MSRRLATLLAALVLAVPGGAQAHDDFDLLLDLLERTLGELSQPRFARDLPPFELAPRFDLPLPAAPPLFTDPDLCLAAAECWRTQRFWRIEPCLAATDLGTCSQRGGLQLVPVRYRD